jgi:hypothetical protein
MCKVAGVANGYMVRFGTLGPTVPADWVGHAAVGDVVCVVSKQGERVALSRIKLEAFADPYERQAYEFATEFLKRERGLAESELVPFKDVQWSDEG